MRWLILSMTLLLGACSTLQDSVRDGLSDAAAATTGVATTVVTGQPALGLAVGTAVGAGVNLVTQPEETVSDVIEALPEEERADVLKHQNIWMTVEKLGVWALLIFGLFWLLPSPMELIKDFRMTRKQ